MREPAWSLSCETILYLPICYFQEEMLNCWCCYASPRLTVTSPSLYSVSGSELALARFRGAQPRDGCHPLLRKWRLPVFAPDLPPPMSDLALSQNQRDSIWYFFYVYLKLSTCWSMSLSVCHMSTTSVIFIWSVILIIL